MSQGRNKLFVLSGPSGAGLGQIIAALFAAREDLSGVTPVTARKMKDGEQDGVGFYFYDLEAWTAMKESGELLEATEFAGNDYGTARSQVRRVLEAGKNALLNLALSRAAQLKASMPEAVCIFVAPTEEAVLRARYEKTARSPIELSARMDLARREREQAGFCDAFVDSGDLDRAVREISALIDEETK